MELHVISTAFYPGAVLIYLFPLPLLIGAAIYSVWHRKNADLGHRSLRGCLKTI